MSHKRLDQLTVSGEWAKHLRPFHKRAFWKSERRAFQTLTRSQSESGAQYDLGSMPTKVRKLLAELQADGWFQVWQSGSHRQFRHPSKPGTVTVAGKPSVEVPPGTLNSILQANRPEEMRFSWST